ncbi:FAD-binding oxidoreductase [Candidatus Poribacteria bacterium]|nr:FAD-binding oxidoreductase [Candidatus Poribacteria bacterium]
MSNISPNSKPKKVVIVGAGIIGATLAYHLSQRDGFDVTLLERDIPGSGASGHSFAWANAFGKDPREYHTLNRRSLDMWYRLAHQLDTDIGIHYGGEMRWENDPQRARQLRERIQQLQAWGYPCRLITRDEILALEPHLSPGPVLAASLSEADIHIETDVFIDVCLRRAREAEAIVYAQTSVTGFVIRDNNIAAVKTTNGEFSCDVVVLASGVQTTELASLARVHIPQQRSPGIVIKTTPCAEVLHNVAIIHAPSKDEKHQHLHLRQLSDGSLRIGQGTQEGINRDDSQQHADALLDRARAYLPVIADAKAIPTPVGYRPMPLDGFPVLGFTEAVPNLYITLMHSGVTLAPLVGEMATIEIADDVQVDWFASYRPERFGAS